MTASLGHRMRRGVSLIEAIVALAVMAFGLVAVVGLQATLRSNADVSRQRTEAVRIAQEEIERWRAFVGLQADAGKVDFSDIAAAAPVVVTGLNASYTVRREVPVVQAPAPKTVTVSVSWQDRAGQDQSVTLNTAIAGISPELAGSLALPQNQGQTWRVNNRNPLIPRMARDFGNGTSGFVPPQAAGPKVVWLFNNVTGLIQSICSVAAAVTNETLTSDLLSEEGSTCDTSRTAQLLSGNVNFANPLVQPDEAEAEAPTGLPLNLNMQLTLTSDGHPEPGVNCFDDSPEVEATIISGAEATRARPVTYFCAIYTNSTRSWSGRLRVMPQAFTTTGAVAWSIGTGTADRQVCRYTTLPNDGNNGSDGTASSRNSAHPLDYTRRGSAPGAPLSNQNFLVIQGSDTCPLDTDWQADLPPANDPVNSSTRVHQNGVAPYL